MLRMLRGGIWRSAFAFALVWVPTLTLFILSFDPALTAAMTLTARALFWGLHVALLLPTLVFAQSIISRAFARWRVHPLVLVGTAALCAAVIFSPVSMVLDHLFFAATDLGVAPTALRIMMDEVASLALPTLCIWLLVNGARLQMLSIPIGDMSTNEDDVAVPATREADAEPALNPLATAFWSRIPLGLGRDLVSMSAEQHYLNVQTTRGRCLILFPFGRAVDVVGPTTGVQVHRSHWAALRHVVGVERHGAAEQVVLSNGARLPISRNNRRMVKDSLQTFGGSTFSA